MKQTKYLTKSQRAERQHKKHAKTKTNRAIARDVKRYALAGAMSATILASTQLQARDCKQLTYENTRTERQALHQKGLKQQAEKMVRYIESCQIQLNGGFTVKETQDLHYSNDAEITYNQSIHVEGRY